MLPMTASRCVALAVALALVPALGPPAYGQPTVSHGIVRSFDDTPIAYTLFLPEGASSTAPVPIVLMTHGWGQRRERNVAGMANTLVGAGYAVLTWDQRGFGDSGGEAQADSQQYEVRDVRKLIDFAAAQPPVLLDGPGDPRLGMVGPSYAGGIQLMTASADTRIDAIVPQITWNDLPEALKPGGVLKLAWDVGLYGTGLVTGTLEGLDSPAGPQTGAYAQEIHTSFQEGIVQNDWSPETYAWFDARSTKHYINGATGVPEVGDLPGIRAPALLVEGTNDTIFPINQAIANYEQIRRNGVDAKMIFFCGLLITPVASHSLSAATSCQFGDQGPFVTRAILTWFQRYLRRDTSADTGAPIDYQLQDGTFLSLSELPTATVSANGGGGLVGAVAPTSGSHVVGTPSPDGFQVPVGVAEGATVLGVPRVTFQIAGIGAEAYLFFRLLDIDALGVITVVDDQVTAKKVTKLSDAAREVSMDLNGVSWKVQLGHRLALEVSSSSYDHASPRSPWMAGLNLSVDVPVL